MIISFGNAATQIIHQGDKSPDFPVDIQSVALRKLQQLDTAQKLDDMRVPPGNRLERLKGDRKGQYSIRINDKYRICFNWTAQGPTHVEILDYH